MITLRIEDGQPAEGNLVYHAAEYTFDTEPAPMTCGAAFAVNELQLMLDDPKELRIVSVEGYSPYQGWRPSVLHAPRALPGVLRGVLERSLTAGTAIGVNSPQDRWPALVDRAIGWVRVGKGDPEEDRDGIAFAPGAIAILEGNHLRALWLRPDRIPAL